MGDEYGFPGKKGVGIDPTELKEIVDFLKGKVKAVRDKKKKKAKPPKSTNKGYDFVISKHGEPLPKDVDVEDFVCNGKKLCIVSRLELLPPTKEGTDGCSAKLTVDLTDCETGRVIETLIKKVVGCGKADEILSPAGTEDVEYLCGKDTIYDITIGYGCVCEKPIKEGEPIPGDVGSGSVRVRTASIKRRIRPR